MNALISIDYTNDFVATTGEAGQKIEAALIEITTAFINNGDFVVFAIDAHEADDPFHPEGLLFPPHNLINTTGQQLYGNMHTLYEQHKAHANVYWMNKRRYSAFCGTDLDIRLRERGITSIVLAGVCTDICVLHTAIDAYNLGYTLTIYEKTVASFNPVGHQWALDHFRDVLGATLL